MTLRDVLLPLFVEVILTFGLLFWAGALRVSNVKSGAVKPQDIALREPNWPARTRQVSYAFSNQFELPVLFYVLTILAYFTHYAGTLFVILAWIFVVFRLLHEYVHVTSNDVNIRGPLFGLSAVVLSVMWLIFMIQVLTNTVVLIGT
jgi:hypothetical protein